MFIIDFPHYVALFSNGFEYKNNFSILSGFFCICNSFVFFEPNPSKFKVVILSHGYQNFILDVW